MKILFLLLITTFSFAQTVNKTVNGLIYKTDFSSLSGWSGDVSFFSSVSDPTFLSFGFHPISYLHGDPGSWDAFGTRQGSIFVENGIWYMPYDGAVFKVTNGTISSSYPWYSNIAISNDRGFTWAKTKQFANGKDSLGAALTYGYAQGGIEKYGSTYYLYRVILTTAGSTPYHSDVWTASSILGTWSFGHNIILESGTRAATFVVVGKPIKVGSTYYIFEQSRGAGNDQIGTRTSSSASGTWVFNPTSIMDGTVYANEENPKPFYDATTNTYNFTISLQSAGITNGTAIVTSSSVSDWSSKTYRKVLKACPLDAPDGTVIGVVSPITGSENTLQTGSNGFIPYTFDSEGNINSNASSDLAWNRRIYSGVFEPSQYNCQYTGNAASLRTIFRTQTNSDFVAEFAIEHLSTVASTYMGFWYRGDGTVNNGYRLDVNPAGSTVTLKKVVGGSTSNVATGSGSQSPVLKQASRIKIVTSGTSHKIYLDGELQINTTDASFSTGTSIGIYGFGNFNSQIRALSMRSNDVVTIQGLRPGQNVIVRSDGKLPIVTTVANLSGNATFSNSHYPLECLDIDGVDYLTGSIWGGDTYVFSGFPASQKRTKLGLNGF